MMKLKPIRDEFAGFCEQFREFTAVCDLPMTLTLTTHFSEFEKSCECLIRHIGLEMNWLETRVGQSVRVDSLYRDTSDMVSKWDAFVASYKEVVESGTNSHFKSMSLHLQNMERILGDLGSVFRAGTYMGDRCLLTIRSVLAGVETMKNQIASRSFKTRPFVTDLTRMNGVLTNMFASNVSKTTITRQETLRLKGLWGLETSELTRIIEGESNFPHHVRLMTNAIISMNTAFKELFVQLALPFDMPIDLESAQEVPLPHAE